MKLLVIRAHPLDATRSRSMRLVDAFLDGFREKYPDALVEDVNLYNAAVPEIDLDLITGWDALRNGEAFIHLTPAQQAKLTLFENYTMQFLSAEAIVVANPLWNLSIPTRLKAWIDTVCRAGVTFRYNDAGEAEGLAGGRTVVHLQASGGRFNGNDPACQYLRTMFAFLGCDYHEVTAEGMDHEPDKADQIMAVALDKARNLGRSI